MSKISKIEISDFRGFDSVRTFELDDAEIVIFLGMNGFGKTSIFDAVEWCLTGHISRYESYLTSGRKQDFAKEKKVLRNKYSTNPHTLVKVELGSGEKFGRRVTLADNGSDYGTGSIIDEYQYGLDSIANQEIDPEVIHHYFSATHILSQETIHHFVTSKKPEDRYKALSVNFGTSLYEPFDDNSQRLSAELKAREDVLNGKLREINVRIVDFSAQLSKKSDEVLTSIIDANKLIVRLRDFPGEIVLQEYIYNTETAGVTGPTKAEIQKFLLSVKSSNDEINLKSSTLRSILADLPKWQSDNRKLTELDKAVIGSKQLIEKIKGAQERGLLLAKEAEQLQARLTREEEEKNVCAAIKQYVPQYLARKAEISILQNEIDARNLLSQSTTETLAIANKDLIFAQNQADTLEIQLGNLEKISLDVRAISSAPDLLSSEDPQLKDLQGKIAVQKEQVDNLRKLNANIDSTWPSLKKEQIAVVSETLPVFDGIFFEKIKETTEKIEAKQRNIDRLIVERQNSIDEYETLNSRLTKSQALLTQALELIPSSGEVPCPVCDVIHPADSLNEHITSRISIAQTSALQTLIGKREVLEIEIIGFKGDIESLQAFMATEKSRLLGSLSNEIGTIVASLENLHVDLEGILSQQRRRQTEIQEILQKVGSLFNVQVDDLKKTIAFLDAKKDEIKQEIIESRNSANSARDRKAEAEKVLDLNVQLNRVAAEKILALQEAEFKAVGEFLTAKGISLNASAEQKISHFLDAQDSICTEIRNRLSVLNEEKSRVDLNLSTLQKDGDIEKLKSEMVTLSEQITEINRFLSDFKEKCSRVGLEIGNLSAEMLSEEEKKMSERRAQNSEVIQGLTELEDTAKELIAFSKEDELRKSLKVIQEEAKSIEIQLGRTKSARSAVDDVTKKFPTLLETYIQKNLDVDLFNQIYRSLNPHRRFKEINFKVEVLRNKVGLNFNATHSTLNARPEFLFSSAQLNTFGVSMFLSMALRQNWLKLDTVLLDDPIQNLDDINVLSLIDLIRGLLDLNKGKQVIISTHDERFYHLVKRKFADYKLKAYRFESYGQVAPDLI